MGDARFSSRDDEHDWVRCSKYLEMRLERPATPRRHHSDLRSTRGAETSLASSAPAARTTCWTGTLDDKLRRASIVQRPVWALSPHGIETFKGIDRTCRDAPHPGDRRISTSRLRAILDLGTRQCMLELAVMQALSLDAHSGSAITRNRSGSLDAAWAHRTRAAVRAGCRRKGKALSREKRPRTSCRRPMDLKRAHSVIDSGKRKT